MPAAHFAAELLAHHLLAVTNAEDRQAAVEKNLRRTRAVIIAHAGRRAGQDDTLGLHPVERLFGFAERRDFGIDTRFAHAPSD